jgi:hypothetical protein
MDEFTCGLIDLSLGKQSFDSGDCFLSPIDLTHSTPLLPW